MDRTQEEVDGKPVVIAGYYRSSPHTKFQSDLTGWLWAIFIIVFILYKLGIIS